MNLTTRRTHSSLSEVSDTDDDSDMEDEKKAKPDEEEDDDLIKALKPAIGQTPPYHILSCPHPGTYR